MVLTTISEKKWEYENVEKNIHKGVYLFGAVLSGQLSLEYFFKKNYKIECFFDNPSEKRYNQIMKRHGFFDENDLLKELDKLGDSLGLQYLMGTIRGYT
jgi:hypothetical protein